MEIIHSQTASPTHEFSFTVSLNSSSSSDPSTVDLTPADDIFFHGQLLPLHLQSECDKSRGHSFNSSELKTNNGEFLCKERAKSKSFSMLRRQSKEAENEKYKKKPRYNMGNFLKKYIKIFSKEKKDEIKVRRKSYSFSEKLNLKEERRDFRGRRREVSAPALMNDGVQVVDSNESSMEELQAAIQAAIAHCKNSIVAADKALMS